ncbi:hypothetical protein EPJ70_11645 [Brachyspira aalborgi]|uniref:Uncharacterized protein n=1 Tax=Brachyspira aalborgi TaxID=29522 RepID=A0A5C8EYS5_9SPIR|nr:hypothetical protein [Brachyspira aalborgi]TXJ42976.1 hypothetical protein EPJ70_11645 [Brachyspira aalborgi]
MSKNNPSSDLISLDNQLTSINDKASSFLSNVSNIANPVQGIVASISQAVVTMKEIERDMQKVEYEFKLLMKKADNDMEKFKTVSVMASNQLTTLSNILNNYSNQVLSIPTNTINEAEIKHRTELLDGINNMSMRITELLIDLMR